MMPDAIQPQIASRLNPESSVSGSSECSILSSDEAFQIVCYKALGLSEPPEIDGEYDDDDVTAFRLTQPWRGVRLAVVFVRHRSAVASGKARQLIDDVQRESLTLVLLPGANAEFVAACMPAAVLDTVVPLFPTDINAIAEGATSLQELFDFKLARRVCDGVSLTDTQFDETLLADYRSRSSAWDTVLLPPTTVIQRRGDDPAEWVDHPALSHLRRRIGPGRGLILIGESGSGKSVLAFQVLRAIASRGYRELVFELSSVAEPMVGFSQEFLLDDAAAGHDAVILLDDLQSQPTLARYCLAVLNVRRRVSTRGAVAAVCTSWPEFGRSVVPLYEDCYPHLVSADQLAAEVINAHAPALDAASKALLRQRFGEDIGILRLAADLANSRNSAVSMRDVAIAYWGAKCRAITLDKPAATALALVCGSLSRYDLPAPSHLLESLTGLSAEDLVAATPGLLRPVAGGYSMGHRSSSGFLVEWLGARGGWSTSQVRDVSSSDDVVLRYLRELSPAAAVQALRGLQSRLGFRPEAKMARRATAIVQIWEAFSAVIQRIEHQQSVDATWGRSPASAMFAAKALHYVGKGNAAAPSLAFLREHWETAASGDVKITLNGVATEDDFESIGDCMRQEDRIDPHRWSDLPAAEVDVVRFHKTWLAGVMLTAASLECDGVSISGFVNGVEALQESDGNFYPRRVVWSTARVLLGLAACGRSVENSPAVSAAAQWLLTPRADGGACSHGVWPSGTGGWNSQLEATAMTVMALIAVGIDATDDRLSTARDYLLVMQPHWTAPGMELDGALAAQAFLEAGGSWDDVTESAYMLSRWAQGEAFWQTALIRAQESLAQSCRVSQIASHLVDIGWRAIKADLPSFLEALAPPDAFRRELLEEAVTVGAIVDREAVAAPKASPTGEEPDSEVAGPDETHDHLSKFLVGVDEIRLEDLVVVGKYCRFDPIGRNFLRHGAEEIKRQLSEGGDWHKNFLIWAPPGTGKSYFVSQIAADIPGVHYEVVNLAQLTKQEWEARLHEVAEKDGPTLCLVDEIDARRDEDWPYDILFPFLDLSKKQQIVFVLVGSAGEGKEALIRLARERPKGPDLFDRIPARQRMEIPPPQLGDRLLVLVSAMLNHRSGRRVEQVEKLALYYALSREDLKTSRQMEDFAVEILSRLSFDQGQIYYDSLFPPGDRENQQFYADHLSSAGVLQHQFVQIIPNMAKNKRG